MGVDIRQVRADPYKNYVGVSTKRGFLFAGCPYPGVLIRALLRETNRLLSAF